MAAMRMRYGIVTFGSIAMINATTMNPEALVRRLRAETARFVKSLARARRGDARGVHRARVASRRLREALLIGDAIAPGQAERLRRDLRRVTAALGQVRELDVALGVLDAELEGESWPSRAVARIREHLTHERQHRARRMHDRIGRADVHRLAQRIDALAEALAHASRTARMDELLALAVRRRARRLARTLDEAGTLYVPASLHRVRIAAKKLRYSLELACHTARLPVGKDLGALRRLQLLLGRLHDLQVLQTHVQTVAAAAAPDRAVTRTLEAIAARCESDCRDLQARFLRMSAALARVAERARAARASHLTRPILRPGRRMARIGAAAAARPRQAQRA
jgi:CHAD domain-containing protein